MVSLTGVFIAFIVFFSFVGALRGWAKEMLVSISVVLALFLLDIFPRFLPPIGRAFDALDAKERFFVQSSVVILTTLFGYAGPTLSGAVRGKLAREKLQDILLGAVLGAFNGYLVVGTIWYFLNKANYPFPSLVTRPTDPASTLLITYWLAPNWLTYPFLYFAVGISFVVVIILWV